MELLDELREDFLTCNICFDEYKDPKQLPCLHTFCRQCLSKYIVGKVAETGADWFPCPFCRKVIQPSQGCLVRAWADSFPTNFLLSQLSSKLQDKTVKLCNGPDDVNKERDVSNKEKCPDHPQSFLLGYCTRRRCGVCEECCVQRHADCIRSHVRERDSRVMAEERRAECHEFMGALQIKLEGIKDTMTSREADLTSRTELLQRQTASSVQDLKMKLDLFLADQKRRLSAQLDSLVTKEKSRLQSVKQQVLEVYEANLLVCKRLESLEDVDLAIKDLATLDKAQTELQSQDLTVDRLRKECVVMDMHFQPGTEPIDQALKALTLGHVVTGPEARASACGGARPRTPRYASGNAAAPSDYSPRGSSPSHSYHNHDRGSWGYPQSRRRTLSPPGGAASSSALSSSLSTAAGPSSLDDDVMKDRARQREELPRAPTTPDFGAVLIEESRRTRSRSLPRRARPASEGAVIVGRQSKKRGVAKAILDRRAPPMETQINGDGEDGGAGSDKKQEWHVRALERAPRVFYAPGTGQWPGERESGGGRAGTEAGGQVKGRRYQTRFERSVSSPSSPGNQSPPGSSEDEIFLDSIVDQRSNLRNGIGGGGGEIKETIFGCVPAADLDPNVPDSDGVAVGGPRGATSNSAPNNASNSEDEDRSEEDGGGSQQKSKRIACVRHFQTTHEGDVKKEPGLVGITAVCRNRVAVSDRWNKVVKLIDIAGRVLDVLAISGEAEPWDVALRRPGLLAVTYPKEQKIRMIDVTDGGSRLHYRSHFMTRDAYASLARYDNTSLIASVCPPFGSPKIHVIDYLGAVLKALDCSSVAYPRCLHACENEEVAVSDWTHHNVKIFPRDGSAAPRLTYSGVPGSPEAQLKAPMGVAWDGSGHVFIVDGKTCKLHALNTRSGGCTAIFSLPQQTGVELKLVTFVEASPDLCSSERALVVTTTTGAMQVYDLCPY